MPNVAALGKRGRTPRRSSWLAENEAFVRRARASAHQAIFLLDHGRATGRRWVDVRLARARGFMLTQVKAVVHAVSLPEILAPERASSSRIGTAVAVAVAVPTSVTPATDASASDETNDEGLDWPAGITRSGPAEILGQWRLIRTLLAPQGGEGEGDGDGETRRQDRVRRVSDALRIFLDISRPPLWSARRPWLPSFRILDHWRFTVVRFLSRRVVSLVILTTNALVLTKVAAVSNLVRNDYRSDGAFLLGTVFLSASLWAIPLAGWWATGGLGVRAFWSPRHQAIEPDRGITRWPPFGGAAHIMSIAFALSGLAVVLWFPAVVWLIDERRRTLFGILSMLSAALFGAHLLDRWDFVDSRPVRFLAFAWALSLGFLIFWSQGATTPRIESALRLVAAATFVPGVVYHVRQACRRRSSWIVAGLMTTLFSFIAVGIVLGAVTSSKEAWRENAPAPSSGVAAAAAAKPLERLCADGWPFPNRAGPPTPVVLVAASGGGSRSAYFTARTLEMLDRFPSPAAGKNIGGHIHAISSVSGGSLAAAAYIALRHRANHPAESAAVVNQTPGLLSAAARGGEPLTAGPLARAVNGDFLWPTIKGFLVPFVSRGKVLEDAWDEKPVGLAGLDLGRLADEWRDAGGDAPPFPMPLFNSCSLDGHDVVISPLPRALYSGSSGAAWGALRDHYGLDTQKQKLTWVAERDGIYGLEQLLGTFNPSLSRAVRASANFPYGFPLVLLDVPLANQVLSPRWTPDAKGNAAVKLTDGGALSNSGLWSLYRLLTFRAPTVTELRRRGVLLVIVEASLMPEYDDRARDVLALEGAIQNKNPMGQYLHREMLSRLERDYGAALKIVQLDVPPSERSNVLTTWAMDKKSQKTLEDAFETVWGLERAGLAEKWAALSTRAAAAVPPAPASTSLSAASPARSARDCTARAEDDQAAAAPGAAGNRPTYELRPPLD